MSFLSRLREGIEEAFGLSDPVPVPSLGRSSDSVSDAATPGPPPKKTNVPNSGTDGQVKSLTIESHFGLNEDPGWDLIVILGSRKRKHLKQRLIASSKAFERILLHGETFWWVAQKRYDYKGRTVDILEFLFDERLFDAATKWLRFFYGAKVEFSLFECVAALSVVELFDIKSPSHVDLRQTLVDFMLGEVKEKCENDKPSFGFVNALGLLKICAVDDYLYPGSAAEYSLIKELNKRLLNFFVQLQKQHEETYKRKLEDLMQKAKQYEDYYNEKLAALERKEKDYEDRYKKRYADSMRKVLTSFVPNTKYDAAEVQKRIIQVMSDADVDCSKGQKGSKDAPVEGSSSQTLPVFKPVAPLETLRKNLSEFEDLLEWPEKNEKRESVLENTGLIDVINCGEFIDWQRDVTNLSIFDAARGTVEMDRKTTYAVLFQGKGEDLFKDDPDKDVYMGCIGSMVGMAIGDAMGARFEFSPFRYEGVQGLDRLVDMGKGRAGRFRLKPGQWTDDAAMGLCLADSLLMNNGELLPHDLMHRFLAWWYLGYNNAFRFDKERDRRDSVGLGGNISLSLKAYLKKAYPFTHAGDKNTSGNGSVMRNAAIPICFRHDVKMACEMAAQQSLVTHQGVEAADCCKLLTVIVVYLLRYRKNEKYTLKYILDNVGELFCRLVPDCEKSVQCLARSEQEPGGDANRNWNWKAKKYEYSPLRSAEKPGYFGSYAMDNMALALHVVYNTSSFEEAIVRIVNMCGDSDDVASVVGQIAGAWYGIESIPDKWTRVLAEWDHGEIALRGYMLSRIHERKSYVVESELAEPNVLDALFLPLPEPGVPERKPFSTMLSAILSEHM